MSREGWATTTLGGISEIVMGQSPAGDTCNEVGRGIPLLNGPTEFGSNNPHPVQFTTNPKKYAEAGDLLFCVRGSTTGKMNWANQKYAIGRGLAALRHRGGPAFQPFLKGIIESYLPLLLAEATGSTFPNVSSQQLNNLSIEVPDFPTQSRIAIILSALDDKIELNRQINATLEAIAQAIFKEWFVNFNFPGATGEMVSVGATGRSPLPDGMPCGWRMGKLRDFGDIVCGKTPSKTNPGFFGGEIPFIKIPDMHNSVFITKTEDSLTKDGASSQKNKFLPPFSVIISCIATVGLVALTSQRSQTNQQINAIIPKNDYTSLYLYFCAKGLESVLKDLGSGGSATLNVNTTSFSDIECVVPPQDILSKFDILVKPLFENILLTTQEISSLSAIRDALLPKLMSGKIEV
jgi:type I restriction enzyme, S subunit